jgi:hypothetical protein
MLFTHIPSNKFIQLFIAIQLNVFCFGQYSSIYKNEFESAIQFHGENKVKFQKIALDLNRDELFVFSIVAPEIGHYSWIKNQLELNSLKVLYVQQGRDYANFSIGFFQMKPSFVEEIEKEVQKDEELKSCYAHCLISKVDEKKRRVIRIKRLETLDWQLQYLSAFIAITSKKFNLKFDSKVDEVKFFSTAYNTGFHKSLEAINHEMQKKRFPNFGEMKFNYSTIAAEYYLYLSK